MNRINLLAITFLFTSLTQAQLLTVASGTNLTIVNGTPFKVDSLTLTPSADFIISNNTLSKSINYYRILQTDMDNRSSYSAIRTLKFTKTDEPFIIIGNPVTNYVLTVQVNMASNLALYTDEGKLLWQQRVNTGTKNIDVSRYAKGTYFLKANNTAQKVNDYPLFGAS